MALIDSLGTSDPQAAQVLADEGRGVFPSLSWSLDLTGPRFTEGEGAGAPDFVAALIGSALPVSRVCWTFPKRRRVHVYGLHTLRPTVPGAVRVDQVAYFREVRRSGAARRGKGGMANKGLGVNALPARGIGLVD